MFGIIMIALLMQGPRNLQIDENDVIMPPRIVPVGTVIPIRLLTRVSTKTSKDGDFINGTTISPITVDNQIVVPVGSEVRGRVADVRRPGRISGKGELTLSFQTLVLPNGVTIPIYTSLGGVGGEGKKSDENSIEGDSSKGDDAQQVGTAAGTGAVIGVIGGGGKGGVIGAAGGAAVGVAGVLLSRGVDLVLEPGTTLEILLDRALER
jgi:type IV secretion system protein VirB10